MLDRPKGGVMVAQEGSGGFEVVTPPKFIPKYHKTLKEIILKTGEMAGNLVQKNQKILR